MRFPTMWYVRPAKPQISLRIRDNLIIFLCNVDALNICMKEFGSEKMFFDKMTAVRT